LFYVATLLAWRCIHLYYEALLWFVALKIGYGLAPLPFGSLELNDQDKLYCCIGAFTFAPNTERYTVCVLNTVSLFRKRRFPGEPAAQNRRQAAEPLRLLFSTGVRMSTEATVRTPFRSITRRFKRGTAPFGLAQFILALKRNEQLCPNIEQYMPSFVHLFLL
jgi:hypothetical protein